MQGGKNISLYENRTHIATCFSEKSAKRLIAALKKKNHLSVREKEPQEYVITEDMLGIWRKGCINLSDYDHCPDCEYQGTGARKGCCDFDDAAMVKIFRSRPVQTDREKVLDKLVKATKVRLRQLFLDDSKCELCEKVDEEDGYDGQKEGCEKGLCIECAIDLALREFAAKLRQGEQ